MKDSFRGYYQPTSDEFKYLWDNCVFVLDANVLLNLYRYTPNTRSEFIKILERISERLWIPNQVALEYQRNRLNVISQQEKAYSEVIEILDDASKSIEGKLNEYRRHPYMDVKTIIKETQKSFNSISNELEKEHNQHPDLSTVDDIRSKITVLFEGKVGSAYLPANLASIYSEGEKRFLERIPPGYIDAKEKKDNSKYSDLVIWYQIIDKAKESKSPIIFICDDAKEDWWWIFSGKVRGPRPELIEEFIARTKMNFYIYSSDRFMEFAKDHFNEGVGKNSITEIKNIRQDEQDKRERNAIVYQLRESDMSEIEYIKDNWKSLLEIVLPSYRKSPALAILRATSTKPILIDGDIITLSSKYAYLKEKLEEPENRGIAEKIFSDWLGRPIHVNIILESQLP